MNKSMEYIDTLRKREPSLFQGGQRSALTDGDIKRLSRR